ncbi:hypothetical protein IWW48_001042 [Coemansia sp. RSA 1200]|nr:hypothetical protein IWW48_001042 [Coemansia sp. RSA 1200]
MYGQRPATSHTHSATERSRHERSKRFSVALAFGKSSSTIHASAYGQTSPWAEFGAQAAKPQASINNSSNISVHGLAKQQQQQQAPIQPSYYNARLNPIRCAPVQRTAYHGVYEGVPYAEESSVKTLRQFLRTRQDTASASAAAAAMTLPMTPVSSTISVEQAQALASWSTPSPDSVAFGQSRPGTSTSQDVEPHMPHSPQEDQIQHQQQLLQQQQRPATSSDRRTTAVKAPPPQRPQTAAQKATADTKAQKRLTGWRDIHVKSLSRVDSILREAVGLGGARRERGSTCAPAATATSARRASGLGISVSRGAGPGARLRPGTAHAALRGDRPAAHHLQSAASASDPPYHDQTMYAFAAVPMLHKNKPEIASAHARPSTSSARLGASSESAYAYAYQNQPLTPADTPTRRMLQARRKTDNHRPSTHGWAEEEEEEDNVNTGRRSMLLGANLPARLHTAAPTPGPQHSAASNGGARVMSMYMAGGQRPATAQGLHRQMSMYEAPGRPIQLSRDESRRSRLFAEYELLVASSTNDDADDDNDNDSRNTANSNSSSTARPATAFAAAGSIALDDISEEAEEEEQEDEEIATEYCGSPPEIIGGSVGLHPEEESDPAIPQQSQPSASNGLHPASASAAAIASRRMRGVYSASMYETSADLVSKKQSERRWSRIICQNQHLFTPQMVAAQIGNDAGGDSGDNPGEEPLLFDIEEVSCSDGEEAGQTDVLPFGRRPLVTQSLVLDLPPPVDLFSDVTKALAERLPPPPQPPSAGSTASESSASTFAHRSDLLFSPEQPLSALPLSMPSQRQKTTAAAAAMARRPHRSPSPLLSNHEARSDDAETEPPEKQRDGASGSRRTSASNGSTSGASEAALEQPTASTRSSIYIDADDILSSAIFATDELPYQQEQRKNSSDSAQLPVTQPPSLSLSLSLSEIQPLVLESAPIIDADHGNGDMMASSGGHRDAEHLGAESAAMHANTDTHDTHSEADSSSSSTGGSGDSDGDSAAKADNGEEREMRRSEYLRQQLDAVEGRTPATQLGLELSKGDRMHQELLEAYMRRFDFHKQPVDLALRQLFQQLRLPSESQQIDRVITSFAQRYDTCNPGLFRSADVVYAHAFAILLLHTDAHNPRIRHKISKQQFVAHARLLDDQAHADGQSEMFDEVLDILYDNVTMVKFEYAPTDAPSAVGMLLSVAAGDAAAHSLRSSASQLLSSPVLTESSRGDHAQSPGISGWLKRVFASSSSGIASNTPIRAPPLLAPLNIPSKAQYSYSTGTRRRVGSITSMAGVVGEHSGSAVASTPQLAASPSANRPSTAHGTFPRAAAQSRERANTTDTPLFGVPQQTQNAMAMAMAASLDRSPHIDTASATFRSSPLAGAGGGGGGGSSPSVDSTMSESPNSLCSPRSAAAMAGAAGIECSSSFSPTDIVVPAQPAMVETIRLSSLKSHVRRRVSLRKGRPLSGIIYGQEPHAEQYKQSLDSATAVGAGAGVGGAGGYGDVSPGALDVAANAAAAAALLSGNALLRVDMAGRVSRKMERLDNGRRGLVRRWKDVWMVLSGSRLYLFRPNDAVHSTTAAESPVGCAPMPVSPDTATPKPAVSIQSIIPLRNGVAVVDSAYTKYPHVFRILAGDGSEVLVKAPSDDAVAEWMARINCAAAFKSTEVERRTLAADPTGFPSALPETPIASTVGSEQRARLLESKIAALDARLNGIDDSLERNLRLFKQLASMVPLTRQGRTKTVHHANAVRCRLKDLYLSEQRLTCYKDVLELDLAIEYELATHHHHLLHHHDHSHFGIDDE